LESSQGKIEICNLGAIEQAEIDLKPLTIFIGDNNTGKTWVAYTLSAILGPAGWGQYTRAYVLGNTSETYPPLDNAIQQIQDEGNATIDLVKFAELYGETYFNGVAKLSREWMRDFLSTERVTFDNLKIQVTLKEMRLKFLNQVKTLSLEKKLSVGQTRKKALLNALKESGEAKLYFYTEGDTLEKLPFRAVKDFLVRNTFQTLHQAIYPDSYTFPTERTTFITFPFVRGEPKEKSVTTDTDSKEEDARPLSTPVIHFLKLIIDSLQSDPLEREEKAKANPSTQNYLELAHILEKEILRGSVDFSKPRTEPQRDLLFHPKKNISIEIPLVSSMVKELSPLVLYLRYLAKRGEWLIIDEPEMNLHPQAQAQLIEFLAMLVNADLHILFTTHSPYMVDHLVNLMKAATLNNKEEAKKLFYLQRTEAFIPKEYVSVYLFENGTAKNILDQEGMINWGTFGKVSDHIAQIYFEL